MVDIAVRADSERYDTTSPTWHAQVADLHTALRSAATGFRVDSAPVSGTKGTADTVILALSSTATLTAATACFRAWLGRDKTRTVRVSWTENGRRKDFELDADAMDGEAMRELMRGLGQQIAGEKDAG